MFRLPDPKDVYPTAVKVRAPRPSGGPVEMEFVARLRYVPTSEMAPLTDGEAAERVLAGWEGVADFDGGELPFSAEAAARACNVRWFAKAVVEAYLERFDPQKNS